MIVSRAKYCFLFSLFFLHYIGRRHFPQDTPPIMNKINNLFVEHEFIFQSILIFLNLCDSKFLKIRSSDIIHSQAKRLLQVLQPDIVKRNIVRIPAHGEVIYAGLGYWVE